MADERGLVVSAPIAIAGIRMDVESNALDEQELRFWLLFWDKLDYPHVRNFPMQAMIQPGRDGQFLADAGILTRTPVDMKSGELATSYARAFLQGFDILDRRDPGVWSRATGEKSFSFFDDDLEANRGALVQLHQAIPVPDKQVALQDILEFREKRRAELLALRHHLEDVYQRVVSAGDGELAWNTEIERLQRAIANHIKTSRETGWALRLTNLTASLNVVAFGRVLADGLTAGLPILGALIPAGAAAISLGAGVALRKHEASPTPFRYISAYNRDLFPP